MQNTFFECSAALKFLMRQKKQSHQKDIEIGRNSIQKHLDI
jgi:hypothetical protein